jgi:hypothetical protein
VAILGTEDFDVTQIDTASIRLEGAAPIRSIIEDVSTPLLDKQDECDCASEGEDGFDDLTLKFDTQEVVSVLGEVADGDEFVLTLTAEFSDGRPVEGKDCITILSKHLQIKRVKECLCAAQWENGIGAADIRTLGDLAPNFWSRSKVVNSHLRRSEPCRRNDTTPKRSFKSFGAPTSC